MCSAEQEATDPGRCCVSSAVRAAAGGIKGPLLLWDDSARIGAKPGVHTRRAASQNSLLYRCYLLVPARAIELIERTVLQLRTFQPKPGFWIHHSQCVNLMLALLSPWWSSLVLD